MIERVVTELFVHPVKGMRPVALSRARVERRGIVDDRRFMVIDDAGKFVTQRTHPALARATATLESDALLLQSDDVGTVRVARRPEERSVRVIVWNDACDAIDAGAPAAAWLGALLGMHAKLVYMPDATRRPVKPAYARDGDIVSFADAFPLLLTTEASLADLNRRLETPVPMNRFRPNVVIGGGEAWDEDRWREVRIGALSARVPKPCDRCTVPNVDQMTGEQGKEPIKTLATFRTRDHVVLFGQNAIPDDEGEIAIGDRVVVTAES